MVRIPAFSNYYRPLKKPTKEQKIQIAIAFNSWIMFHLFEIIHAEFIRKSKGLTDSLGVKWKPLSESRRIYKSLQRGEISPKTRRKIREGRGTKKELLADRNPPINIDTKRLLNSLKPGAVIGGVYIPSSPDQKVTITPTSVSFEIVVPYAEEVQEERPFLPVSFTTWLDAAIEKSIPKLRIEMSKNALI